MCEDRLLCIEAFIFIFFFFQNEERSEYEIIIKVKS